MELIVRLKQRFILTFTLVWFLHGDMNKIKLFLISELL